MTSIHRFCPALLLCAAAAGCAHYQARPITPEQTAAALESRTLDDPGLRSFLDKNLQRDPAAGPARAWDFEMLTLAAFYYHPDLEVARAEWEVTQAAIQTAGGRLNPTLNVTPGLNFSHVNAAPGLSPWFPTVSLDVPLETAGKRGYRIAQARQLSESARLNIAATARQVRAGVRSSLLDFSAARRREALLQNEISIQQQVITLLDQQIQAGAMAAQEAVSFRIALQKSRLDLADAQREGAESRAHLAESIGVPVRALDGVEISTVFPDNAAAGLTTDEIRREALLGRADILAALADYAAAQSALQLEIANQYPDVHLSPGYQFDQGDNMYSLGLTVELPVLNQNQGPIAEAAARRVEAAARFSALQSKVLADIDAAVESFRATEKSLSLLQDLAKAQAASRDAIAGQVSAGAAAPLDLLNAQLELAEAEEVQLEAQVKRQQSVAALEDAVQRPIEMITPGVIERNPAAAKEKKP